MNPLRDAGFTVLATVWDEVRACGRSAELARHVAALATAVARGRTLAAGPRDQRALDAIAAAAAAAATLAASVCGAAAGPPPAGGGEKGATAG